MLVAWPIVVSVICCYVNRVDDNLKNCLIAVTFGTVITQTIVIIFQPHLFNATFLRWETIH